MKIYNETDYLTDEEIEKVMKLFKNKSIQNEKVTSVYILNSCDTTSKYYHLKHNHFDFDGLTGGFYDYKKKIILIFTDEIFRELNYDKNKMKIVTVSILAHELRHLHQYKTSKVNLLKNKRIYKYEGHKYRSNDLEIDARKFAEKFVNKNKNKLIKYLNIENKFEYKNNCITFGKEIEVYF